MTWAVGDTVSWKERVTDIVGRRRRVVMGERTVTAKIITMSSEEAPYHRTLVLRITEASGWDAERLVGATIQRKGADLLQPNLADLRVRARAARGGPLELEAAGSACRCALMTRNTRGRSPG